MRIPDGFVQLRNRKAQLRKFSGIGKHQNLLVHRAAHIHHGHLGQLLDAFGDDFPAKTAELRKRAARRQGDIDKEGWNVRGAGLHHLRAVHIGQKPHGPVYLFIDFDKKQVDIGPVVETEFERGAAVPCLTHDILKGAHLNQLTAKRGHHAPVHLAGRHRRGRCLDRDVGNIHFRNQRHRQQSDGYQAQDHYHEKGHGHRYGPVYDVFDHYCDSTTSDPSARFKFPLTITRSPSEREAPRSLLAVTTWLVELDATIFT